MAQITAQGTPRQTIPFADRPIIRNGGYPTEEFQQWAIRLQSGASATITNVTTIVSAVNAIDINIGSIVAEISSIESTLTVLANEIAALDPAPPAPLSAAGGLNRSQVRAMMWFGV